MAELCRRPSFPRCLYFSAVILVQLLCWPRTAGAQILENPIATIPVSSSRWKIKLPLKNFTFADGSLVSPILIRANIAGSGIAYACGFYCRGDCASFLFAIYILHYDNSSGIVLSSIGIPQVVWAANRAREVKENAALELTSAGELILYDAEGTMVWSSGTAGKSVVGMNMTESGKLVLFGGGTNRSILWESFSSPTDTLVPGQKLLVGQNLTANMSSGGSSDDVYFLVANSTGLAAFVNSNSPQRYAFYALPTTKFFEFRNGSLFTNDSTDPYLPPSQYLRLESDGGLRVYEWRSEGWVAVNDLLNARGSSCFSPTACGSYGICSGNNQCVCPSAAAGEDSYFRAIDGENPKLGCSEITPLSCENSDSHSLLRLDEVSYFTYDQLPADISGVEDKVCRDACSTNCSCRAAFFMYGANVSSGSCFLTSKVFSLKKNPPEVTQYNSTAFIKVQMSAKSSLVKGILSLVISFGATRVLVVVGFCVYFARKKDEALKRWNGRMVGAEEELAEDVELISGMPRKFSLEDLRVATDGFSKKLGQGGFGSVYGGRIDGEPVAVKHLDGVGQGRKEFLAEVQTIGKIHHLHLVKFVGYCAERSSKLLVYEYMPNGSLDRWIFHEQRRASLGWATRRKIILGIAKALAYLHEECAQRIAHLDIKPQNILLDEGFEAKVSDFGLAKLIDRDQTHVETQMRGTVGYLAPEWLSSVITEKADVYSFGVVVLEVVTGRRNLDRSLPVEDAWLVQLTRTKARAGELGDLIDSSLGLAEEDSADEAARTLQLGLWCLQQDDKRRPSMSTVVKVLEGTVTVEVNSEYDTWVPLEDIPGNGESSVSALLSASVLSGAR